jgi:hypothetical protein
MKDEASERPASPEVLLRLDRVSKTFAIGEPTVREETVGASPAAAN